MKATNNKHNNRPRLCAACLLLGVLLLCAFELRSQSMSVNSNGALPHNSAMLDVKSTDKGFLMPRMTQLQRDAITSPAHGLMIYQLDGSSGLYIFDSTAATWAQVLDSAGTALTLADVLGNSSNAAADSIYNLSSLGFNVGPGELVAPLQVDSTLALLKDPATGISGYMINVYHDGTDFKYMKTGIAGAVAGGSDFIGLFYWPPGTTGAVLPQSLMQIQLKDSSVVIGGEASDSLLLVQGNVIAKGAVIDSLNINSAYTMPATAGSNGDVLTMGTMGSVSWAAPVGDDLGNHTATQTIETAGHFISNDGDNEGIGINADGTVYITPVTSGLQALTTNGFLRTNGNGSGIEFTNNQISITGNNGNTGDMIFETGLVNRMRLTVGGQLGIGNMSPSYLLDVNGPVRSGSGGTDGQYILYSEQGLNDYEVVFNPNAAMTQNTTYTLPADDGTSGQFLSTDGSGGLSWSGAAGDNLGNHTATQNLVPTTSNTYDLGSSSLYWQDIYMSSNLYHNGTLYMRSPVNSGTFLGANAGQNVSGAYNTFFGYNAGDATTSGSNNLALGAFALTTNTTGIHNIAVGDYALFNTTGFQNIGIGVNALYSNQGDASNGNDNVAIGYNTMYSNTTGDNNTAVGREALYSTIGDNNVAIGRQAGYLVSSASNNNVFVGYQAGSGAASHSISGSVFLGYQAGYSETNSNRLYIDNSNTATPLIWGDFASNYVNFNGSVGIGTTTPASRLNIYATDNTGDITLEDTYPFLFLNTSTGNNAGIIMQNAGASQSELYWAGATGNLVLNHLSSGGTDMVLTSAGNFGIQNASPTVRLQVDGGSDAGLTGGTGYLLINDESTTNLVIDDNEIMARSNGSEAPLHLQAEGGELHVHNTAGGTAAFTILDDGSVGVGTTSPATHFHLNHPTGTNNGLSLSNASGGTDRWHFYVWSTDEMTLYFNDALRGTFNATTGAYSSVSDARFKTAITDAPSLLARINQLKVREYAFTGERPEAPKHIGLIAQEVLPLFPELVTYSREDDRYLMDYSALGIMSVKAIQEQHEIIEQMQQRIDELEQQVNELTQQMNK